MAIGALQSASYTMNYAGYPASGNQKINEFYQGLSSATEKSNSEATGDVLGLTTIKYSESVFYGMTASYSKESTNSDPVIRISSNYGGEKRAYDVHVSEVNPSDASQLEMFALSCYLDDQGITDKGTYGSFSRMKAYAINDADNGDGVDLQDSANASKKIDWVSMLQRMSDTYLANAQTYQQYLDCNSLATALTAIIEKMKNQEEDETEPTYQIGSQTYTDKEWNQMIKKVDKSIDAIVEAQKEHKAEKEKEDAKIAQMKAQMDEDIDNQIRLLFEDKE